MAVEVFANQPATTVSSGGTDAPASGTQETWTVASSAEFAAASSSGTPPTQFHVADVASSASSELIAVINISGTTWTVLRGAEGTTPVAHVAGFTIYQVVSANALEQASRVDWLNLVTVFGADNTGATLCDTAFINAAAAIPEPGGTPTPPQPLGGGIYIPPGTYLISETLDWKINGLKVLGDQWPSVVIVMQTNNIPIVQVAGYGQEIAGITFAYETPQTSAQTSGICITFGDDTVGSCFMSSFHDLFFQGGSTCMSINPAIAGGEAGLFSCHFDNIQTNLWSVSAMTLIGNNGLGGANCTGCVFDNIYLGNANTSFVTQSGTNFAVEMRFWDEFVFNQLNVEHVTQTGQHAIACISVRNAVFNAIHCEGVVCSTNAKGILYCSGTGSIVVNGLRMLTCTFSGASENPIVTFFGSGPSTVAIHGYSEQSCTITTPSHPMVDFNSATNCSAVVNGIALNQTTSNVVNSASGDTWQIGVAGNLSVSSGVVPVTSGFTAFGTGGGVNLLNSSSGANVQPAAPTWYYSSLYVPFNVTLTGLQAAAGSPGGTADSWNVALWPIAGGSPVANSVLTGTSAPATNTKKSFPFTAPVAVSGPGVYVAGVQSNGTLCRLLAFSNAVEGFVTGTSAGSGFGTVPSLSPASTYTQNVGPQMNTY